MQQLLLSMRIAAAGGIIAVGGVPAAVGVLAEGGVLAAGLCTKRHFPAQSFTHPRMFVHQKALSCTKLHSSPNVCAPKDTSLH